MLQTSKETKPEQLELATEQGAALQRAVDAMRKETDGTADFTRIGDYEVGFAVEEAEGLYRWRDGNIEWQDPTDENAHIEVVVRDPADGRFIAGLDVRVTVVRSDTGEEIGSHRHSMLWHPWLHHYGRNWTLPGEGEYNLRIHVGALMLERHDKVNGGRFTRPVDVEFNNVRIKTGQKKG